MERNPRNGFFADFLQQPAIGYRRWQFDLQSIRPCRGSQGAGLLVELVEINIEQRGKVLQPGLVLSSALSIQAA